MIYIQNKKAWKELLRDNPNADPVHHPFAYPLYAYFVFNSMKDRYEIITLHFEELKSMIDKIEKGREF